MVDDSHSLQLLLKAKLRIWGHTVTLASNGLEGWNLLREATYDLIICDWDMPEMDGLELCRLIRSTAFAQYLYVILCTGKDQKADMIVGMSAGADDFITKPVDFAELSVRLTAAERVLRLQKELADQNQNLRELNSRLTEAYDRIEHDLQSAAATQVRLLPKKEDIDKRVKLDWLFLPSRFLAGDMLNYFMADNRHLIFYHLDVSGHGIPAALLSVTLNKILLPVPGSPVLRPDAQGDKLELAAPAEVVSELNARFQGEDDTYFTMAYGILDLETRELRFCQAGHPGPVILRPNDSPIVVGQGGFPVGMVPGMTYEEQSVQLGSGDCLLLYSDGLSECENAEGVALGEPRLIEMFSSDRSGSLGGLMEAIWDSIGAWRGQSEFADDLSVLGLKCA